MAGLSIPFFDDIENFFLGNVRQRQAGPATPQHGGMRAACTTSSPPKHPENSNPDNALRDRQRPIWARRDPAGYRPSAAGRRPSPSGHRTRTPGGGQNHCGNRPGSSDNGPKSSGNGQYHSGHRPSSSGDGPSTSGHRPHRSSRVFSGVVGRRCGLGHRGGPGPLCFTAAGCFGGSCSGGAPTFEPRRRARARACARRGAQRALLHAPCPNAAVSAERVPERRAHAKARRPRRPGAARKRVRERHKSNNIGRAEVQPSRLRGGSAQASSIGARPKAQRARSTACLRPRRAPRVGRRPRTSPPPRRQGTQHPASKRFWNARKSNRVRLPSPSRSARGSPSSNWFWNTRKSKIVSSPSASRSAAHTTTRTVSPV